MQEPKAGSLQKLTHAQEIFKSASPDYQTLIKDILREERDVMHLKRRSDIHTRIFDIVKRVIK